MEEIVFVTSNEGKFREAESILNKMGVRIVRRSLRIEEKRSESITEVARQSALMAYAELGKPLFVEDSGLFTQALDGFPGAYSAWVFSKIGNEGMLKLLEGKGRGAEFRACVAYADPEGVKTFEGLATGNIAECGRGTAGFGFDPIFIPGDSGRTCAEEPSLKKDSHRARALRKFGEWIRIRPQKSGEGQESRKTGEGVSPSAVV
jgi:XTP/dITP diphosphohydrolase